MNSDDQDEIKNLEIVSIIGFDGNTLSGFRIHPNGEHVIYPLGNKVSIQHWVTKKQYFLTGHTNIISSIDVSRSGNYIASGQINHIGFKAMVIIWDFHKRCIISKHEIHKVRVESIMFSCDDRYLISLGGRDCGSVVVWDIGECEPICGSAASRRTSGDAMTIFTTNRRGKCFLTGGDGTLRLWTLDTDARSISSVDINLCKLKRVIQCITMDERDEIAYCGTTSGDILKIKLNFHHDPKVLKTVRNPVMVGCFGKIPNKKRNANKVDCYSGGVRTIYLMFNGVLIVGAGDGLVDMVVLDHLDSAAFTETGLKMPTKPQLRSLQSVNVRSGITSIQVMEEQTVLVGTVGCEIYSININDFKDIKLLITCHVSTIYNVAFPVEFSEVFATASKEDVRIWGVQSKQELVRIHVPNFCCSSVEFSSDGKSIITAWNDGVIRAFTPLTGRLIYAILNAHNKGVSALAVTRDASKIVSGGCEGQVRVWDIQPTSQKLLAVLKEHKGPISDIHINSIDTEAVSASTDGTCIIWDIIRMCRKQILFRNTLFMTAKYYPTDVQLLTSGSDRKIGYWEVFDGSMIRELEGSVSGAINSLDISPDGSMFVTGGNDQIIKLWKYEEGITTHIGLGHSGVVTAVRFSPDGNYIVSTSASGSIFIWKCPITREHSSKSSSRASTNRSKTSSDRREISKKDNDENINEIETVRSDTSIKSKKSDQSVRCCNCNLVKCVCPKTSKTSTPSQSSIKCLSQKSERINRQSTENHTHRKSVSDIFPISSKTKNNK